MTEWKKCSEYLPKSKRDERCIYATDESYAILVSINGKYFIGEARTLYTTTIRFGWENIIFDLYTNAWFMPNHYRLPDFWMELPELPKEE